MRNRKKMEPPKPKQPKKPPALKLRKSNANALKWKSKSERSAQKRKSAGRDSRRKRSKCDWSRSACSRSR